MVYFLSASRYMSKKYYFLTQKNPASDENNFIYLFMTQIPEGETKTQFL